MKLEDLKTIPFEVDVKVKFCSVTGGWDADWRTVNFMIVDAYPNVCLSPTIEGRSLGLLFDVTTYRNGSFVDPNGLQMVVLPMAERELLQVGYANQDLLERLESYEQDGVTLEHFTGLGRVFVELYKMKLAPEVYEVFLRELGS